MTDPIFAKFRNGDYMRRVLSLSVCLVCSLTLAIAPASAQSDSQAYKYQTALICNGISSTIISVCTAPMGICSSQKWLVGKREIELTQNNFSVSEWACMPSRAGYKTVFYLGNAGNCPECEGFEIWDTKATASSGLLFNKQFDLSAKKLKFPIKKNHSLLDQFEYVKRGLPFQQKQ
jgi:hypothetical protein